MDEGGAVQFVVLYELREGGIVEHGNVGEVFAEGFRQYGVIDQIAGKGGLQLLAVCLALLEAVQRVVCHVVHRAVGEGVEQEDVAAFRQQEVEIAFVDVDEEVESIEQDVRQGVCDERVGAVRDVERGVACGEECHEVAGQGLDQIHLDAADFPVDECFVLVRVQAQAVHVCHRFFVEFLGGEQHFFLVARKQVDFPVVQVQQFFFDNHLLHLGDDRVDGVYPERLVEERQQAVVRGMDAKGKSIRCITDGQYVL